MQTGFLILAGLFTGGVLNVVADRMPPLHPDFDGPFIADRRRKLAWWEWLPLLSSLGVMRKRRMVVTNNRLRYPALELATAGLFVAAAARFHQEPAQAAAACAFSAALLTLGAIDLETRYLPYRLSIPTLLAAASVSVLWPGFGAADQGGRAWWEGLAAGGGAFGFFYGIHLLGAGLRRPLMGDGDAYLAAALGALLGLQMTFVSLYITAVLGGVFAIGVLGARAFGYRVKVIPYGPYMVAGGLAALLYGRAITDWFLVASGLADFL
jgi:leader peptidase (prepilin peptidase)/N-methyltransferase